MIKKIQSVRGMNDYLPHETDKWRHVESIIKRVIQSYGYREIRTPILEQTSLFKRGIGEVTDIVEKEMYTFNDRAREGEQAVSLTMRPEGTAGCVRAGIEHGFLYNQEQRLWYLGPMFRHERPQKGRYRQFHQMGVEVFGLNGPDIDAELILLTARWWRELGIEKYLVLELNSIGSVAARASYRQALILFLEKNIEHLDEDCTRRMYTNPLRVLDSKNSAIQALLNAAPQLFDYLDEESKSHFNALCALLDQLGIQYRLNQRLVRGLDYYNRTVFEWVTQNLGAQGTVCAGGRYDGLVAQLGGQDIPAVGFAMGMERLVLLVQELNPALFAKNEVDIYLVSSGQNTQTVALELAENLRNAHPSWRILTNHGGGNFKKQFARADKWNARVALVIGENELVNQQVVIKNMSNGEQVTVSQTDLLTHLAQFLS